MEAKGSSVALPPILRMSRRKTVGRRRSGTPIPPEFFDLLTNYTRFRVTALQQVSDDCGRPLAGQRPPGHGRSTQGRYPTPSGPLGFAVPAVPPGKDAEARVPALPQTRLSR